MLLLYDHVGNWIGVRITNRDTDGNIINLPNIGAIDYPMHNGEVVNLNDEIILKFDKDIGVDNFKEQDCNLDIHPEGIYGVEMILWAGNNINLKEKVRPFIKRDI